MQEALNVAALGAKFNEVPVGAVVVLRKSGEIISKFHNLVETNRDSIAHAEILAIKDASKKIGSKNLFECDLYVTLEPCGMCAGAISHSRIGRLFYGASDFKYGAIENGCRFFATSIAHHKPEIYGNILSKESSDLLKKFFQKLR